MSLAIAIGAKLRQMRLQAGLTQAQVADRSGTHRAIVARIERGIHCPTLEIAVLHAEVCGGSAVDIAREIDREAGLVPARKHRVSAKAWQTV